MKNDWKQQGERSNAFTLRLILWIARHLGRRVTRLFLYPIVGYFLLTSPAAVRASKHYLARVFGRPVGLRQVARHLYCFSATILDRVYFLTDQHSRYELQIHHREVFEQCVAQPGGCLLLGTHLGSFEVLRSLAVNRRFPLKILMYREHNQRISSLLDALNPEINDTVIDLGAENALLLTQEALQQGYCVGMLGDRVTQGEKSLDCDLLGARAAFPLGPLTLAAVFKVPVVLFFGLYRGGNRYDIFFEQLVERMTADRTQRQQQVEYWTRQYVRRIEYYVRLAPYNWFNYFDYWNDYSG